MKKFLSLVLALVMTVSLVTVVAGAKDFTDDSKINYSEAVDVMSSISIIDGYTDGAFNPANTLTRGAAAKIICNLILGPTTASALGCDAKPFKDVAIDNVFAGYIAYCSQEGIINGYADGTFRPAGTVTGFQFLKMLLGALGYDSTIQGFTGANWSVAVAKLASSLELTDGNDNFVGTKAMTREEACLYALNTLQATMVEYKNKGSNITINGVVIAQGASDATKVEYASVGAGNDGNIGAADGYVQFAEQYFSKLTLATGTPDSFGAPANVWTYKNDEVGTYAIEGKASYTAEATYGDLYTAIGSTVAKNIATLTVKIDNVDSSSSYNKTNITKGSSTAVAGTGNGVATTVYVQDSTTTAGKYDVTVVMVKTYIAKLSSVTAATASKDRFVTLSTKTAPGTLKSAEFTTESFAKSDFVLYTASCNNEASNTTYTVKTLTPATLVSNATVTAVKGTSNFTAGGTTYKYNVTAPKAGSPTPATVAPAVDDALDIYTDANGYVVYFESYNGAVDLSNYMVLTAMDESTKLGSTTYTAKAVTLDGKLLGEITLGKLGGNTIKASNVPSQDTVYSFSTTSAGKYDLKAVSAPYATAALTVNNNNSGVTGYKFYAGATAVGSASVSGSSVNFAANSATTFVVYNSDKDTVTVYTGIKNMVNVANNALTSANVIYKTSGTATAVFLEVTGTTGATSSAKDLIYVLDATAEVTKSGDDTIYTYAAIVNGAASTISSKNSSLSLSKGLYYIEAYEGAYVTTINAADASHKPTDSTINKTAGTTTASYGDDVLTLTAATSGAGSFVLASDCAIYKISTKGVMSTLTVDDLTTTTDYDYTVVTMTNNNVTTATAIYVQAK